MRHAHTNFLKPPKPRNWGKPPLVGFESDTMFWIFLLLPSSNSTSDLTKSYFENVSGHMEEIIKWCFHPPQKRGLKFIKKNMPMPELHTEPALSRVCVIFFIQSTLFISKTRECSIGKLGFDWTLTHVALSWFPTLDYDLWFRTRPLMMVPINFWWNSDLFKKKRIF